MPPPRITFNVEDLKTVDRLERVLRQFQAAIGEATTPETVQQLVAAAQKADSITSGGGGSVIPGVPGVPTSGTSVTEGTHALRLASFTPASATGALYYETDRTVIYIALATLVWEYLAGVMVAVLGSRPADLGTTDAGFLFIDSATNTLYRWDGAAWVTQTISAPGVVGITIDGGASTPTTGSKGFFGVTFAGTITAWTLIGDAVGSAQITIKKGTPSGDTNMPATASIVASDPPSLSTQQRKRSTALSGWTVAIAANDVLEFNLDSVTTCKRLVLEVTITRS